jgi:hypothetical protein
MERLDKGGTPVNKKTDLWCALLCAAVILACAFAAWPFAELPFNDDFSYAFTARKLAQTGHLVYNGWASAALVPQAYWGALFIKIFGFSFTVLRLSMLPIAAAAGMAAYALGRKCGLRPDLAILAALTLCLSPLFLPLATSFMTDIGGLLFALLALYAVVAAGQARSSASAIRWMALAVALALVGGTLRQIMWMTAITGLPCVIWLRRRERATVIAGIVGWALMVVGAWATLKWFAAQPFSISEQPISVAIERFREQPTVLFRNVWSLVLTLGLATLPVIVASVSALPRLRLWQWMLAVGIFGAILIARHQHWIPGTAPWIGNTITWNGVMGGGEGTTLGPGRPPMLPGKLWASISMVVYVALAIGIALVAHWLIEEARAENRFRRLKNLPPSDWVVAMLLVFALGYFALVLPRSAYGRAYDRYVLPLYPCVTIPLLLMRQRAEGKANPQRTFLMRNSYLVGWIFLTCFTAFAVAATQEVISLARARVVATSELTRTGIPKTEIDAGFEYTYWSQLEAWGYINDWRLKKPPGAHKDGFGPLPACHLTYRVEFKDRPLRPDEKPTKYASVSYFSLLPPFHRTLVIRQLSAPAAFTGDPGSLQNDDHADK